jgi:radical SAM superfamily enzyme YgiQ (UPF0313 family)
MVYKQGPRFKVRAFKDIKADLREAADEMGHHARTLFLPAGNSLAMPTDQLAEVCREARRLLPNLERITVYASMSSIEAHGLNGLIRLREAGLSRLHVGLESGHGATLNRVKKGTVPEQQVRAGRLALEAGLDLCLYVLLGLAGPDDSLVNALATAEVINRINQAGDLTVRLRTLIPKINTLLLHQMEHGRFKLCSPHEIIAEMRELVKTLDGPLRLYSDHYTNYLNLKGRLPGDRPGMLQALDRASRLPREAFRADFVGTQ